MGGYSSLPQLQVPDMGAKAAEMVQLSSLLQAAKQRKAMAPVQQQQAEANLAATTLGNKEKTAQLQKEAALNDLFSNRGQKAPFTGSIDTGTGADRPINTTTAPNAGQQPQDLPGAPQTGEGNGQKPASFGYNMPSDSDILSAGGVHAMPLLKNMKELQKSDQELKTAKANHDEKSLDYMGNLANAIKDSGYDVEKARTLLQHAAGSGFDNEVAGLWGQIKSNPQALHQIVDSVLSMSPKQRELHDKELEANASQYKQDAGTGTLVNVGDPSKSLNAGVSMPLDAAIAKKAGIPELAGKPYPPQLIKSITEAVDAGNMFQNADGRLWLVNKQGDKLKNMGASTPVVTAVMNQGGIAPGSKAEGSGGSTVGNTGLTQQALDQTAEKYYQTGEMPRNSYRNNVQSRAIMNRAAELHPNAILAATSQEFKANSESLKRMQASYDAMTAFESTANKNIDLLLDSSKKVLDTGSPWLNSPLRMLSDKLVGSENVLAMNAARQVAVNEIAKVTSNPTLSGQLSDTARKEVSEFIPSSATFKQTVHVAQTLKKDMENRKTSMQEQMADIKKRMTGSGVPIGATGKAKGSDGQMHWVDKTGKDYGVAQ